MIHDNLQIANNVDTRYLMLHALYVMENVCAIQTKCVVTFKH